jgi:hypothetical protein
VRTGLRQVLFIFATPSNPAGFYFLTNDLKMSSTVLGTVNLLGSISSVIGISLYQAFLKAHAPTCAVLC